MHLEKFQVDKIQNGRLLAIIHLDSPDIVGYHDNRSRYLQHFYKTNCFRRGCILKKFNSSKFKMAANRPLFLSHDRYLVNRARWLDHYYKTKCDVSGENAF